MGKVIGILAGAVAAAAATWFIGMRTKWRPVVDLQRRVNRDFVNPRMLARTGQANGPSAVVHHTGRRSGTQYATPVDAVPTPDGFVIASVYSSRSDWIRNVLAGGPASVERDGVTTPVTDARVVPLAEVADCFSESDRRGHRAFGIKEAVLLRSLVPAPDSNG